MKDKVILLVEDNMDDAELTILALKSSKNIVNEIVHVKDGEEALEYLFANGRFSGRQKKDMPVLILLDLKMPKVDGLEVLKEISKEPELTLIPIVVFTSSIEEQDLIKSYELGVNSYIQKPVDGYKFEQAVHQLGVYWLLLNETPFRR